jgi:hypothetical protein
MQLHSPNIAPLIIACTFRPSVTRNIDLHPNRDHLSFALRYRLHHFPTDSPPVVLQNYDPL